MLENKDLRKKIEDLRKEKLAVSSLLEGLRSQRDSFKNKYEELSKCNEEAVKSNYFKLQLNYNHKFNRYINVH